MTQAWTYPVPEYPRPYRRPRHKRPGRCGRMARAAVRGAARVTAFPLWPDYIVYKRLELFAWK